VHTRTRPRAGIPVAKADYKRGRQKKVKAKEGDDGEPCANSYGIAIGSPWHAAWWTALRLRAPPAERFAREVLVLTQQAKAHIDDDMAVNRCLSMAFEDAEDDDMAQPAPAATAQMRDAAAAERAAVDAVEMTAAQRAADEAAGRAKDFNKVPSPLPPRVKGQRDFVSSEDVYCTGSTAQQPVIRRPVSLCHSKAEGPTD